MQPNMGSIANRVIKTVIPRFLEGLAVKKDTMAIQKACFVELDDPSRLEDLTFLRNLMIAEFSRGNYFILFNHYLIYT